MAYEGGTLDTAGMLKLFSVLIQSGRVWGLQGSYGRTACALIERGFITKDGRITEAGKAAERPNYRSW